MEERKDGMFCAWRRYFARSLDLFIYGLLWSAAAVLIFHINIARREFTQSLMDNVMQVVLMLLIEPLLLNRFRTTPGKAVFGIRVTQESGERLTVSQGFSRTLGVLIRGMGLSVPVYNLYTYYKSYRRCADGDIQPWDEGISYTVKDTKGYRWFVLIAANAAVFGALVVLILSGQIPPNRGQLTVAEFAENYNYLARYYNLESQEEYLGEDGTWQKKPENGNVVIDLIAAEVPEFQYEVRDGYVAGISFSVELKDKDEWMSTYNTQMMLAVLAYAGAQKGIGLFSSDRSELAGCVADSGFKGYQIAYRGVGIRCERESEGYLTPILDLLIPDDDADSLYYRTDFYMGQEERAAGADAPVCTYRPQ